MDGVERSERISTRQGSQRNMISRNNSSRGSWRMEGVFSGLGQSRRHSRGVDEDEEALKWAAIEKLPTYDRLRTSIMQFYEENETGINKEVDVRKLDGSDRDKFISTVFKVAEEDNEKFLKKFRRRIDR